MKKIAGTILIGVMLIGIMTIIGCGQQKAIMKTEEGEITIEEKDGKILVTDEQGEETTWSSLEEVSEKELGIPIYPYAELQDDTVESLLAERKRGKEIIASSVWETTASVSDVIAWYRERLSGMPNFEDASTSKDGEELGRFDYCFNGEVKVIVIGVNQEKGTTEISIASQSL